MPKKILVAGLLLFLSVACHASGIEGTYRLVKDSDGVTPKKDAVVTITFKGAASGSVSMKAVQPGETVTDTGTFSVNDVLITILFKEMVWEVRQQRFSLEGCYLVLPFKALSGDTKPGSSTWIAERASCRNESLGVTPQSPTGNKTYAASPKKTESTKLSDKKRGADKKCDCNNIEDIRRVIGDEEYLRDRYQKKAAELQADLDIQQNIARRKNESFSRGIAEKSQNDGYLKFVREELPMEFRQVRGYENTITVTPDPKNMRRIDPDSLKKYAEQAACKEFVDAVKRHEQYHIDEAGKGKADTPIVLANEEVQAYEAGLGVLRKTLEELKKNCKWQCINPDSTMLYDDHRQCELKCPSGLGKPIVKGLFRCKNIDQTKPR